VQELITKILDLFRELLPLVIGWFSAKQDSKIDDLKNKVETIEKYEKIDNLEKYTFDKGVNGLARCREIKREL